MISTDSGRRFFGTACLFPRNAGEKAEKSDMVFEELNCRLLKSEPVASSGGAGPAVHIGVRRPGSFRLLRLTLTDLTEIFAFS